MKMSYESWLAKWTSITKKIRANYQSKLLPEVQLYLENHIYDQFQTSGKHGGEAWDFSSEPKYQKRKEALWGSQYASKPLLVPSQVELLRPAMLRGFSLSERGLSHTVSSPNASSLIRTGGKNPFGEPYPARNPYVMTRSQRLEIKKIAMKHVASAWREP